LNSGNLRKGNEPGRRRAQLAIAADKRRLRRALWQNRSIMRKQVEGQPAVLWWLVRVGIKEAM
jgi:hypothetical protein